MTKVTLETLHKDIEGLKREVYEIKQMIIMRPELSEEVIAEIEATRKRMKTSWVSHKDMLKEFA
jgi:hypothetical protein